MKQSIYIKDVGEIVVLKSKRSKRMRLTMKPFSPVKISIPLGISLKSAKKFALDQKGWIINNRQKMEHAENKRTFFSPAVKFNTKFHEIKLLPLLKGDSFNYEIKNYTTIIRYGENMDIDQFEFQEDVRNAVTETLRAEAKQYLPHRLIELAEKNNLTVNKISVRKAKTRWGSCSSANNISLNVHLMLLPDELIDYVLLHELAHTKEKNHSKFFWAFLAEICENALEKNQQLKNFSPSIW